MTSLFTFISKILPAVFRWNIFITSWTQKLKELVKLGDTLFYSLFQALRWSGQADARKSRVKTVVGGRRPLVLFRYRLFQPCVFTRPVSVNWGPRTGNPFQDSNLNVCKTTVRDPLGISYIKNMLRYHLSKTSALQFDNRIFGPEKFSGLSRNRPQARVPFRPFSQPLKCCSSHNCKDHSLKISSTLTSKFTKKPMNVWIFTWICFQCSSFVWRGRWQLECLQGQVGPSEGNWEGRGLGGKTGIHDHQPLWTWFAHKSRTG